jgi:hypothetical protein
MNLLARVNNRINKKYNLRGKIRYKVEDTITTSSINHEPVIDHSMKVSLLLEAVADALFPEQKTLIKRCFLAGILHDIGKLTEPYPLFNGQDIKKKEIEQLQRHPIAAHEILVDIDRWLALCAGLHHPDYGLTLNHLPRKWNDAKKNNLVVISLLLFLCDNVEAFNRNTRPNGIKGKITGVRTVIYDRLEKCPDKNKRLEILESAGLELEPLIDLTERKFEQLNFTNND